MSEVSVILKHARTILHDSRIPDCPSYRPNQSLVSGLKEQARDVLLYYATHHLVNTDHRRAMRSAWDAYSQIVEAHSRVPEGFSDNVAALLEDIANLVRERHEIVGDKRVSPLVGITITRASQLRSGVYFSRGFLSPTVSLVSAMKEKGIPCESLEARLSAYNSEIAQYCAEPVREERKYADTRITT